MDCRLEGVELGKYQLVFASAEKVFVKPFLLLIRKKKQNIIYHQDIIYHLSIKQIIVGKPLSAVVCLLQSIIYNQMEETLSNKLTAATLKDCWLKNIEGSKYKLIFVTTEEVSSKPFLSWLKQMLHHFTHQFCVYFVFFSRQCFWF